MNIDIEALDLLPETDPISATDLDDQGLRMCAGWTCMWTCWSTCRVTEA